MLTSQINMVVQKTSVATARSKAVMLNGVHAPIITSDTPIIVSRWAHQLIIIETDPLEIVTDTVIHMIVVAVILVTTLVIDMITGNAITSIDGHFGCYLFCLNLHEKGK